MTWAPWAALLVIGCSAPCRSVHFPPVAESGATEDIKLYGCYQPAAAGRGTALLVHGFGRDGDDWQSMRFLLADEGISTLTIDLRGHGQSRGRFPVRNPGDFGVAANDVRGALAWLANETGADSASIVLVGASLGGGAVIANALERPGLRFVAWYPGLTYLSHGDSLLNLGAMHVKGMIVQGSLDEHPRANPALTRRFLEHNPAVGVTWIPGGTHGAGPNRRTYESVTVDSIAAWLQ